MAQVDKILEVKNLTVSFKTPSGMVRAVRDVTFDLYRNETLCIVGESGSGKSVTNRAVLGILAGNGVIDDGQILYRGENLVAIEEQDFHRIRGTKIAMIFQDPLSSLNPIMKVGRQITEAILLHKDRIKRLYGTKIEKEFIDLRKLKYRYRFDKQSVSLEFDRQYKKLQEGRSIEVFRKTREQLFKNYILGMEKAKTNERGDARADAIAMIRQEYAKGLAAAKAVYANRPKDESIEFRKQVNIISHQYESDKKAIIDEFKRLRPNLQDALNQAKIKAQQEVQTYRDAAVQAYHQAIAAAADLNDPKQRKQAFGKARNAYVRSLRITKQEAKERVIQLMKEVGIPEPEKRFYHYPFQYSGGMRQRIVIAIALATDPEVLICDEPTTALDVTIQSQILELINKIKKERKISIIFITHNLGVVANMADRIAVMYAGKIVEFGETNEIFYNPSHPYTWALLSSMPDLESRGRLDAIPGTPPNMLFPPKGDAFAPRNKYALKIDYEIEPPMFKVSDTHFAATWLLHDYTPSYEAPAIVAKLKAKKEVYDLESDS